MSYTLIVLFFSFFQKATMTAVLTRVLNGIPPRKDPAPGFPKRLPRNPPARRDPALVEDRVEREGLPSDRSLFPNHSRPLEAHHPQETRKVLTSKNVKTPPNFSQFYSFAIRRSPYSCEVLDQKSIRRPFPIL